MLKKSLTGALLLMSSFTACKAQTLDAPAQFFVKQHWFSLTNTFDVESVDRKFGTVHRKLLSWTPQYLFFDAHNQLQAKAKMRFFSLGATFDVWDAEEAPLGKVDEKILKFFATFDIYRANGYHAATAILNFWGTKYKVKDPDTEEVIAILWRKFFRLKDDWTVDIVNPALLAEKKIDPRMFILVMAFQTDRDYWSSLRNYQANSPTMSLSQNISAELIMAHNNLEQHRNKLESYRDQLSSIEPSDADIKSLEEIVERRLEACEYDVPQDANVDSRESMEMARIQAKERGLAVLMPLFDSEELAPGQKSALYLLMEQELN